MYVNIAMKKLFDVFKISWKTNETRIGFFCYVSRRGIRYQETLKWVKPEKVPVYHPARSGDLVSMPPMAKDALYLPFRDSKELQTANEKIKKVFSLGYQNHKSVLKAYEHELVEKVKNNSYETWTFEICIARLTAKIRFYKSIIEKRPTKFSPLRCVIKRTIDERFKMLKFLRQRDYKKFEWLLETLDLEYRPPPEPNVPVTRKNSLMLLAKLKVEQTKEEKLAELKKSFDEQKIPFLLNKIMKLKEIKEKEKKYNLQETVTDADIEECIKRLEKIKVEVAEKTKRGYKRKIHPYFLELYDEDLLIQQEQAGAKIREKQMFSIQNKKAETSSVEK